MVQKQPTEISSKTLKCKQAATPTAQRQGPNAGMAGNSGKARPKRADGVKGKNAPREWKDFSRLEKQGIPKEECDGYRIENQEKPSKKSSCPDLQGAGRPRWGMLHPSRRDHGPSRRDYGPSRRDYGLSFDISDLVTATIAHDYDSLCRLMTYTTTLCNDILSRTATRPTVHFNVQSYMRIDFAAC